MKTLQVLRCGTESSSASAQLYGLGQVIDLCEPQFPQYRYNNHTFSLGF